MADRTYLDWPFFDDTHRTLVAELEDFAVREIAPHAGEHDDVDGICRRFVAVLGEAGWLRYCVPAEAGGVHANLDVRYEHLGLHLQVEFTRASRCDRSA